MALAVLLALLLPQPASARDLRQVAELAHRTRVLIDRDTLVRHRDGDRTLRQAVISIDNSRNPAASVEAFASDNKIDADCAAGELRVLWTRVYDPDGKLVRFERPGSLHEFDSPKSPAEHAALDALCGSR